MAHPMPFRIASAAGDLPLGAELRASRLEAILDVVTEPALHLAIQLVNDLGCVEQGA